MEKKSKSCNGFTMFGKTLKAEQYSTHLGVFRDVKKKINTEEKVTLSRKTAYALMGAGLHSGNGLTKQLCAYLWNTYCRGPQPSTTVPTQFCSNYGLFGIV